MSFVFLNIEKNDSDSSYILPDSREKRRESEFSENKLCSRIEISKLIL